MVVTIVTGGLRTQGTPSPIMDERTPNMWPWIRDLHPNTGTKLEAVKVSKAGGFPGLKMKCWKIGRCMYPFEVHP
jgi:hypothetical protein